MMISRKVNAVYFWPLLILVSQLMISSISFYGQHKLQTDIPTRTAANERLEAKLNDINCAPINKEALLEVMKGQVEDEINLARILFGFGMLSVATAVLALMSLAPLKKKDVSSNQV